MPGPGTMALIVIAAVALATIAVILLLVNQALAARREGRSPTFWWVLAAVAGVGGAMVAVIGGFVTLIGLAIEAHTPQAFDPAAYAGPTAVLALDWPVAAELATRYGTDERSQLLACRTTDGRWTVPAGTHQLGEVTVTAAGSDRTTWTLRYRFGDGEAGSYTLAAGSETALPFKPPATATVAVVRQPNPRLVTITPRVADAAGRPIAISCSGTRRPGFRVLDAAGREVWSGTFEYG